MTQLTQDEVERFQRLGFCIPKLRISEANLLELANAFGSMPAGPGKRLAGDDPLVRQLSLSLTADVIGNQLIEEDSVCARAIFFAKSRDQNWLVPWHQDVTLAVPKRMDLEGWRRWTMKDGMWHAQPPGSVLAKMAAIRIHVDPCGIQDGPLRVIPSTHWGKLSASESERLSRYPSQTLCTELGGIIVMHPLTLHSSTKASGRSLRRVLHLEYCARTVYPTQSTKYR